MGGNDEYYADGHTPKPSHWPVRTLVAFASLTLGMALVPFGLLRCGGTGRRARRNRRFVSAVAAFFVPLMAVDPNHIYAMHAEAMTSHAALAALATTTHTDTLIEYTYDDNGNLTDRSIDGVVQVTYAYDAENRLVRSDPHQGLDSIVFYTYDDDGIRRSKSVGGRTIHYTTDKNRPYAQVLEERDADTDTLLVRYVYGHDLISQTRDPEGATPEKRYFFYDGQMSTRTLVDPTTGEATDTYTYDAFGNELDPTYTGDAPTENAYRYTGEQYDKDLGQYYLRARYYDQSIGRFTTRDTFGGSKSDPMSLHRYLYAKASPIDHVDPSGLIFTLVGQVALAGIRAILRGIDAMKIRMCVLVFRVYAFLMGGVMAMVTRGQGILTWLSGSGQRGVEALQRMFLRSSTAISRAQATQAPEYVRRNLNNLLTGGPNNPANVIYHHLVEQHATNIRTFGARAIHSLANIAPTPTTIHQAISNFCGSRHALLPGFSRLRDWMMTLSWEEQYLYGLQIWQNAMQNGGNITWHPPV